MRKTEYDEYPLYKGCIPEGSFGAVYPLSIAEKIQSGDIYTDGSSCLFRHRCGFGYIYGKCGEAFLDEIYKTFLSAESRPEGRFVLMTADEAEKDFFAGKPDVSVGRRYYFEYPGNALLCALARVWGMRELFLTVWSFTRQTMYFLTDARAG